MGEVGEDETIIYIILKMKGKIAVYKNQDTIRLQNVSIFSVQCSSFSECTIVLFTSSLGSGRRIP